MTSKGKKHTFKRSDLIDNIIDMRVNKGLSRVTIFNFLNTDLGYSKPYSYELIQEASKEFDERTVQNFGQDLKEDIERWEARYESALMDKDKKEARFCLVEICKLKGHYVERVEHTIKDFKANFGDEDDQTIHPV